jgi:electron transfer flavoprotein alpha subunit
VSTLVFLEHHDGELQKGALGVLAKAAQLGDATGVVVGSDVRSLAEQAGKHGASKVFVAEDAALDAPLPQPRVDVLASLVRDQGFDTVLFGTARRSPRRPSTSPRRTASPWTARSWARPRPRASGSTTSPPAS